MLSYIDYLLQCSGLVSLRRSTATGKGILMLRCVWWGWGRLHSRQQPLSLLHLRELQQVHLYRSCPVHVDHVQCMYVHVDHVQCMYVHVDHVQCMYAHVDVCMCMYSVCMCM